MNKFSFSSQFIYLLCLKYTLGFPFDLEVPSGMREKFQEATAHKEYYAKEINSFY